jgi:hypothetical protein
MQPYTTYDLILNVVVVIVMPLLIIANLKGWNTKSAMNVYLWREHPNLMKVSLGILGLLSLYSLVQLAAYAGLASPEVIQTVLIGLGIPFLVLAVAEIWLSIKAVRQYLRSRGRPA